MKKPKHTDDLRILAIWMNSAADTKSKKKTLRELVRCAAENAAHLYGPIKPKKNDPEFHDEEGVRQILAEFASYLDEFSRDA